MSLDSVISTGKLPQEPGLSPCLRKLSHNDSLPRPDGGSYRSPEVDSEVAFTELSTPEAVGSDTGNIDNFEFVTWEASHSPLSFDDTPAHIDPLDKDAIAPRLVLADALQSKSNYLHGNKLTNGFLDNESIP